jgi:salicylate hydroxylase
MRSKPKILIVGAGIGGLTAALALMRRGIEVAVFERAPELAEVGAGLHVSPNGTRVLFGLGLKDRIESTGVCPQARYVALWNTGQHWPLPNHDVRALERYGSPYLCMHRGDLHSALVDAVRTQGKDVIRISSACTGFDQDGTGVELQLANGDRVRADALIGADGIHSTVRRTLYGADQPQFTGYLAWRGLIPIERAPASMRSAATNWISHRSSVTLYPVRRGELLNFIGNTPRSDWQTESWIERGTIAECAADFEGWHEDIQHVIRQIETPYKWGVFTREPLPAWTQGRVSLLGDACHSMRPTLGQGANMALEDGIVLARCLDDFGDDPATALQKYENARRERTTRIVRASGGQSTRRHDASLADPVTAARYIENEWAPNRVQERYDWIYEYDAQSAAI